MSKAKQYIQRQTARRLLEGVVRELNREAYKLDQDPSDGVNVQDLIDRQQLINALRAQTERVRDALALMVGEG